LTPRPSANPKAEITAMAIEIVAKITI